MAAEFDAIYPAVPPGLKLAHEIVTPEEETQLIGLIEASGLTHKRYDQDNPRSSTSYGWTYDFQNDTFVPCEPLPEGFRSICKIAGAFGGVDPDDLSECLLNRYGPGAIIQPHLDKPVWEHVIGISLGAPATMQFRKQAQDGYEQVSIELPPRSIYLLSRDARHVFQHSLLPLEQTRWSITFRSYSEEGRRLRDRTTATAA